MAGEDINNQKYNFYHILNFAAIKNKYSYRSVILFLILIHIFIFSTFNCSTSTEQEISPSIQEGDIIEFYQCTVKPEVLVRVDPVYPDSARAAGIEGMVVLKTLIGVDSLADSIAVLRSVPALDQAAIDARRQYRF